MTVKEKSTALVYESIRAVQEALASTGIGKDSTNKQQGYKFRGIDAVYKALAPLLAKHDLTIIPRTLNRECVERRTKAGGTLFSVALDVEFDFVNSKDGSVHTARTFGEGADSADKATNKALTAAYKYLCFMIFCIPLEGGQPDADNDAHDDIEPEVPTFEEVADKIDEAKALKHLQNIWNKYKGNFKGEELAELIMRKDVRKGELTGEG